MKKDISSIVIVLCVICILVIVGFMSVIKLIDIVSKPDAQATEELSLKATQAPVSTPSSALTDDPSASTSSTPEVLKIDSYTSWWSTYEEYYEGDFNFSITGDDEGTMYLMDCATLEMQKKDFKYEYIDNILTFNFEDDTYEQYRVSKNEINDIVLIDKNHFSLKHNCYSYSDYMIRQFSANEFTAYGCWYLYNTSEDYLETISLWHNKEGIYYNSQENEPKLFSFSYSDYVLTLQFEDYTKKYTINHLGNILELSDCDTGLETFMFRAHETILAGKYQLNSSSNDNMKKMNISLDYYGELKIEYDNGISTIYGTKHSWYVDRADGYLGMYDDAYNGKYLLEYNYYFTENGLYLVETDFGEIHYLEKVD